MSEVVGAIRRVTDIVGEISAASHEQSLGVAQVGEAVTQMDQVTQQNAALVEEMAAAASSLKSQAEDGGRQEGPVQRVFGPDPVQRLTRGQCALLPFGRELGRVHELHAGRHEQAACTTHHQNAAQACLLGAIDDGAGAAQELVVDARVVPAWVVGADHGIVPGHGARHLGGILGIGLAHRQAFPRGELGRVAGQRRHAVAALQQFLEHGRSDKTGGADQSDVHGGSPGSKVAMPQAYELHNHCGRG
jgi:hypothetical protein